MRPGHYLIDQLMDQVRLERGDAEIPMVPRSHSGGEIRRPA